MFNLDSLTFRRLFTLPTLPESAVELFGWIRTIRRSSEVTFLRLYDGTTLNTLQVVIKNKGFDPDLLSALTPGSALSVTGTVIATPKREDALELQAESVKLLGKMEDPEHYPIAPKEHSLEFLREVAHLRPRTQLFTAIAQLRDIVAQLIHQFFHKHDFLWLAAPILTAADCEGAGELFAVQAPERSGGKQFFSQPTFLTVSGQLNAEAYAMALSRVYCFGPTFRAENSNTSRHLAEFWMIEPEAAFFDLSANMQLAERLFQFIAHQLLANHVALITFFQERSGKPIMEYLRQLSKTGYRKIEYSEAITILQQSGQAFEIPVTWGCDLASEHERFLTESYFKEPIFVINYPRAIKAFYMRDNDDGKTVAAMDLLVPGIGEILGGSQREERLERLEEKMEEANIAPDPLSWYCDLRRMGGVVHSGFGVGFERLICYLGGLHNVRDAIPFPRTPGTILF